ncbi:Crp/Fnr family transcriptional regulator [Crassaminicella thermophila]|uniref:Crp/Fnr family transcriptional regulator n=1 Tax=Crassaminicella thermophila TaxID=2599308 RepID=A0A5C0SC57_CRATE|nr:Crp/Fnr family transcriptional regulator [Crassaminicella thermophila]QEK11517.1 Crp/Fnr family transcriptional regulator [Crassaminicella thermophila]
MDIKNYIDILRTNNLFKNFSNEELLFLFNNSNNNIYKYEKNRIIHFESEKCTTLDVVLEGKVLVQRIDEYGNVLTITQFQAGDDLGLNSLFGDNHAYPMSVIAKSNTVILHIKKNFVLELCQNNRNFLIEILRSISNKALILTNKIKSISIKSLRESIIDFLSYEYYTQKTNKIKLNITKKELAERLGVQRTSLSRELNKMKKDGLIIYDAHSITIKDLSIIK